jgi:hypothetical protein
MYRLLDFSEFKKGLKDGQFNKSVNLKGKGSQTRFKVAAIDLYLLFEGCKY